MHVLQQVDADLVHAVEHGEARGEHGVGEVHRHRVGHARARPAEHADLAAHAAVGAGLVHEQHAVVGLAVREGVEAERRRDHRQVGVERQPAHHALGDLGAHDLAARERREQPGELLRRADRQLRRVVGSAVVAHEVEQGRAGEAERLGARAHRLEADVAQQHVRGQVVTRARDECGEVGERQRRRLHVLPDARVAHGVARRAVEHRERLGARAGEPGGDLDEQQHLADGRRRHHDVVVDREQHLAGREIGRPRRDLHARERELAEGVEAPGEVLVGLLGAVLAVSDAGVARSAFGTLRRRHHSACTIFLGRSALPHRGLRRARKRWTGRMSGVSYQIVTRSAGSSQRASSAVTPKPV